MTKQELDARIDAITREAEEKKHLAYKEFAKTSAKYKVGDIVSDGQDTIRVETISYNAYNGNVSIFYWGPRLTKKGEPYKGGGKRAVFESAIKND